MNCINHKQFSFSNFFGTLAYIKSLPAFTFARHYNTVKRTFYTPSVSQQFVTEMSVHKCVSVAMRGGAFVRKGFS